MQLLETKSLKEKTRFNTEINSSSYGSFMFDSSAAVQNSSHLVFAIFHSSFGRLLLVICVERL